MNTRDLLLSERVNRQYIGARYVIKVYENSQDASSAEWESDTSYEPFTLVTYQNSSYLSKKGVPATVGNPAANPRYWVVTGAYNGQIADLQSKVQKLMDGFTTPEQYGARGDGVTDDTEAVQAAFNSGEFIVLNNKYKITNTLFIDGNKTIIGKGTIYSYLPAVETDEYLILLGATSLGVAGEVFRGTIDGINFEIHNGNYNVVIGGYNSDNTVIRNCTFDCQNGNVKNKVIFFGNNATVVPNNSQNKNYLIDNCYFIFDSTPTTAQNPCENIGIELRKNVTISNNTVVHGIDDMGIHQCANVNIIGNRLIENFQSRIFVSNSYDVNIVDNLIQVAAAGICQGIQVCYETTYNSIPTVRNFHIEGNTVDYSENTDSNTTYGIRLQGLVDSIVTNNNLIGNDDKRGRIVLETQNASGSLLNAVVSNNVTVKGNKCVAIVHGISAPSVDSVNYFYNNIIESYITLGSYDITGGNVLKNTGYDKLAISRNMANGDFNLKASLNEAADGTEKKMLINGFPKLVATEGFKLYPLCMCNFDDDITLGASNTYVFTFYKNGTSIGSWTRRNSGKDAASIADANRYFAIGDVLEITVKITGTLPDSIPSHYQLATFMENYNNF